MTTGLEKPLSATQETAGLFWDLAEPRARLGLARAGNYQKSLENRLSRLVSTSTKRSGGTGNLAQAFTVAMQLDTELSGLYSLIELCDWHDGCETHTPLRKWLDTTCGTYVQWLSGFIDQCSLHPQKVTAEIHEWLRHFESQSSGMTDAVQRYKLASHQPVTSNLLQRPAIDPQRGALHHRLHTNSLAMSDISWSASHKEESERYFRSLLPGSDNETITLSLLREIETEPWSRYRCSLQEALDIIVQTFTSIDSIAHAEVISLYEENRLWVSNNSSPANACFDTPLGSYISCHFSQGLDDLIQLGHEIGHAIHFKLNSQSTPSYQPLAEITQETWALATENALLESPQLARKFGHSAIDAYKRHRSIEMNHRQRMLTEFESALHATNIRTQDDINALWLTLNHAFYGDMVTLDAGFETAWQAVHHITTSPFYLSVYGPAKERADKTTLTSLIKNLKHKETTPHAL